jgi:hypothetical protein
MARNAAQKAKHTSCGLCGRALSNYDWANCQKNGCGYSREFTVYKLTNPPPPLSQTETGNAVTQ